MGMPERGERLASPEKIQLKSFTPALALKFAPGDIGLDNPQKPKAEESIPDVIDKHVVNAFEEKQKAEREAHWKEAKPDMPFGQQMEIWLRGWCVVKFPNIP